MSRSCWSFFFCSACCWCWCLCRFCLFYVYYLLTRGTHTRLYIYAHCRRCIYAEMRMLHSFTFCILLPLLPIYCPTYYSAVIVAMYICFFFFCSQPHTGNLRAVFYGWCANWNDVRIKSNWLLFVHAFHYMFRFVQLHGRLSLLLDSFCFFDSYLEKRSLALFYAHSFIFIPIKA